MLSRNLEKTLHRALANANERRHEYATLEHLLLALTEDQDAMSVLRACTAVYSRRGYWRWRDAPARIRPWRVLALATSAIRRSRRLTIRVLPVWAV